MELDKLFVLGGYGIYWTLLILRLCLRLNQEGHTESGVVAYSSLNLFILEF